MRTETWVPDAGGLFSVALSLELPPLAVNQHHCPVEPGLSSRPSDSGEAADYGASGHLIRTDETNRSKNIEVHCPRSRRR